MKIIIEPLRSVIPSEYHTTKEYEFIVKELDGNLKETIENCIGKIDPVPSGMVGVSLLECEFAQDFFVSIMDGKMQKW